MKGEYNQECNITSCQKPNSAIWFNHSTRKYYCSSCARRLNTDPYNAKDAQKMFGHALCTLDEVKNAIEDSITTIDTISEDTYRMIGSLKGAITEMPPKTGRENRRERRAKERKNK